MMTYGDLVKRLIEELPGTGANEARKRINRAIRSNQTAHHWRHLLVRGSLHVEAPYSTGLVAIAAGGTAVTLTGGTWATSWTTAPSMRRIVMKGRTEPYDITISGAAAGTLSEAWLGSALTGATTDTYTMFRDVYPFASDCGYGKTMTILDLENGFELDHLTQPEFYAQKNEYLGQTGTPENFTVVHLTSESPPRVQIEFGPVAPDRVLGYRYWYFKRPAFITSDSAYPEWPEEFEDMHWIKAAIDIGQGARRPHRNVPIWRQTYAEMWAAMKKELDGDAAVRQEIQSVYLGSRRSIHDTDFTFRNYRLV